jgi:hypothetical protein
VDSVISFPLSVRNVHLTKAKRIHERERERERERDAHPLIREVVIFF